MFKRFLVIIVPVLFLYAAKPCAGQAKKHTQLIQFSGVVLEKDSLQRIPYVAIIVKKSSNGTIADNSGYFSFIVVPGDTIEFSALGYKNNYYMVPDTLTSDKYSLIHIMERDTTAMKPFVFYSWPSKAAFEAAFLKLDIPSTDLDRAKRNMAIAARMARYGNMDARSPSADLMNTYQQEYDKLYNAGQYPPNNLLNPIAWGQFIEAWKDGSLKVQ